MENENKISAKVQVNNLYKCESGKFTLWVSAPDFEQARQKAEGHLNKNDYGYSSDRKMKIVTLIGEGVNPEGKFEGAKTFIV